MTVEETLKIRKSEGTDLSDLKKYTEYRWFVQFEGAIVGSVSLKDINHMMMFAEIGYMIDEAYQGRGIATAAVRLLVEKAFSESELRKLIAYVHDQNLPSRRVLEKLGFTQEGLLREHYIINGRPENEVLYGLLRSGWNR